MASRLLRTVATLIALAMTAIPASAQTQGTIAKIKERGKLLAGVKLDTPPFGFLDDKNEPAGFDIEIVRKIAARIGVPVELVKVTSATRIPLRSSIASRRATKGLGRHSGASRTFRFWGQ